MTNVIKINEGERNVDAVIENIIEQHKRGNIKSISVAMVDNENLTAIDWGHKSGDHSMQALGAAQYLVHRLGRRISDCED